MQVVSVRLRFAGPDDVEPSTRDKVRLLGDGVTPSERLDPHAAPVRAICRAAMDMSTIKDPSWVAERLTAGDTVASIAQAAGVSRQTAHMWIIRHRLPSRQRQRPTGARLHELYAVRGSIVGVAAELEEPAATVHRWLIADGVVLRRPGAPTALQTKHQGRLAEHVVP